LAPVVSEVLFGSTRLSYIFVLLPQIMVWGCGTLIIRETVRRKQRGWISILLLGLALAVAEECIIQQTSLAPLVGADPTHAYGREFGVNWIWLLAMLGYESVWVALVPVQLTELIFWAQRDEPWVSARGILIVGGVLAVGPFIAWYAWTQRARPLIFHAPIYRPAWMDILVAAAVMFVLVIAAFTLPIRRQSVLPVPRAVPQPTIVAALAFMLALPWFALIKLSYGEIPGLPPWLAMIGGIALAVLALTIIVRWSSSCAWQPMHRLALVSGAIMASMVAGFGLGPWRPIDLMGKIVFNVTAVLLLIGLTRRLARCSANCAGASSRRQFGSRR
jgi:hypothetical protein